MIEPEGRGNPVSHFTIARIVYSARVDCWPEHLTHCSVPVYSEAVTFLAAQGGNSTLTRLALILYTAWVSFNFTATVVVCVVAMMFVLCIFR